MAGSKPWRSISIILMVVVVAMASYLIVLLVPASDTPRDTQQNELKAEAVLGSDRAYQLLLSDDWPDRQLPGSQRKPRLNLKHDYQFERDWWHQRHVIYWTQALERYQGLDNVRYLEVGVFEGASFFWVLEKILTGESCRAIGIDPFLSEYNEIESYGDTFYRNLELSGEQERTTIIKGFSQIELRKLPLDFFDIIYIDGSHRARDVLEDAILSWRLLKKGGVLIFDDYELEWELPITERARVAIDIFYKLYREEFEVTHYGYQVMMTRRDD